MAEHKHEQQTPPTASDLVLQKGLPANLDSERFLLALILLNSEKHFDQAREVLDIPDFSLEKHRRIFARMKDIAERGERIDRVTVANELKRQGQLESVDGLAYLVSLDHGMPDIENLGSYARIVKEKAIERTIIQNCERIANRILLGTSDLKESVSSILQLTDLVQDQARFGQEPGVTPGRIIQDFPGGINAFLDPTKRQKGLMTGWNKLDELTGGFLPGQIIVIAGRTSSGKSAAALNIVERLAFQDPPVKSAIFTFEMTPAELLDRLVNSRARVDSYRVINNFLNKEERLRRQVAVAEMIEAPIVIYGQDFASITALCAQARRAVRKESARLLVVDHLGLIQSDGRNYGSRANEISSYTRRLKLLGLELEVPILELSQLSRPSKNMVGRPPDLEDLKDTSSIEQDANMVMMIYWEWLHRQDRAEKDKSVIYLRKNRGGAIGKVDLLFRSGFTRFENPEPAE